MGVKQKTPTPFVGAGSVRTVTPNLTGVGTAIADGANKLLQQRFVERAELANEAGTIAGENYISYDENGKLQSLANLPEGNTYYEQALRKSAKITYLNALKTDVKNFSEKFLMENPDKPDIIEENMSILLDNYLTDMPEDLHGSASLILNEYKNVSVNTALNNKIIKDKEIASTNAINFITNLEREEFYKAERQNLPLNQQNIQDLGDAIDVLISNRVDGYTEETKPTILKRFIDGYNLHQKLYKFNNLLENYDPNDLNNKWKIENEINSYEQKVFEELQDENLKIEWKELTKRRYNSTVQRKNEEYKFKNSIDDQIKTEAYENWNITVKPNLTYEDKIISPEKRIEFKDNLNEKFGVVYGTLIWQQNYQSANDNYDHNNWITSEGPIWTNIILGNEGYTNYEDVYNKHPENFNNRFRGIPFKQEMQNHFAKELKNRLDSIKDWNLGEFKDRTLNLFITTPGTSFHYTNDRAKVRKAMKNFIQTQFNISDTDWKPSDLETIMNAWDAKKIDIIKNLNMNNVILDAIQNGTPIDKYPTERDNWLEASGDNHTPVDSLNANQSKSEIKKMLLLGTAQTKYGNYLAGAESWMDDAKYESIMPALDELFNNPNEGKTNQLRRKLKANGVNVDFLENLYKGYRSNDGNVQLAREYAFNQEESGDNTKREQANYFNSFAGVDFWFRKDIDVTDKNTLIDFMKFRLDKNLHANKGFIDAWLLQGLANWNDPRYRPIVKMMDKIKGKLGDGVSFDSLQHVLPDEFWDAVEESVFINWNNNKLGYQKNPKAMNNVIDRAMAMELGNWYPEERPNADGDPDSPPVITWTQNSIINDATTRGGWGKSDWEITPEIISAEIGAKLSAAGVKLPDRIPAEEIGLEITDEKWAKSWLDVDFNVRFSHSENGYPRYSMWYTDQYGIQTQIMSENEDGTRSPLYWDYNYNNSMVRVAEEAFYKRQNDKSLTFGKKVDGIIDDIRAKGFGGVGSHKDTEYFLKLIPAFIDGGEISYLWKEMLKNQQKQDTREYNENWYKNNLGSFLMQGGFNNDVYKGLSLNAIKNAGMSNIFNIGN